MTAQAIPVAVEPASARHVGTTTDVWGRRLLAIVIAVWAAGLVVGFRPALAALMAVGFAAAIAGINRPSLGLLGVGMLCALDAPARVFLLTGGLFRYNTLNYWLLVVLLLFAPLVLRLNDAPTRLLLAFVTLAALELLLSADPARGAQDLLGVVSYFGLLVYFARAAADREVWYWLALVVGMVSAAGGLVYYTDHAGLPAVNPNVWSIFPLTALFAICLGFAAAPLRPRGRLLLAGLATLSLVWVFLSGSRGALLTALCCMLAIMVTMRGVRRRVTFLAGAALIALAVSTQFGDLQEYSLHRLDKLLSSRYSMTERTSRRSDIVQGGWRIFLAHPMGVGTGGFARAWTRLDQEQGIVVAPARRPRSAHAGWVKVLAENGVPGALIFVGFVLSFAVAGLRTRVREIRLLGLLATAALGVALLTTEFQSKGIWFLAAGATTLLHRRRVIAHVWYGAARAPAGAAPAITAAGNA